jgi:hypothetical protein
MSLTCFLCREVWELDVEWVGYVVTGAWLLILPASILGLVLGDQTPWRRVSHVTTTFKGFIFACAEPTG